MSTTKHKKRKALGTYHDVLTLPSKRFVRPDGMTVVSTINTREMVNEMASYPGFSDVLDASSLNVITRFDVKDLATPTLRRTAKQMRRIERAVAARVRGWVQANQFLELVRVAAKHGWNPDLSRIRGSGASQYVRAGGAIWKCWTLLMSSRDGRTFTIEAQGGVYEIMCAFLEYREMNKQQGVSRSLLLLSPGNWIAARWKP